MQDTFDIETRVRIIETEKKCLETLRNTNNDIDMTNLCIKSLEDVCEALMKENKFNDIAELQEELVKQHKCLENHIKRKADVESVMSKNNQFILKLSKK